ncbi:hypothetical protein WH47_12133 [Habropoda laboriosa]|uniref:Uncharacterized protein n=1 Tax=Habropoda laboriosa TaxID=597456 RepID=A0A0L7RAC2_9HYME|nr:hypothetical protein WH47_12133 [Habropoda laboriosa]
MQGVRGLCFVIVYLDFWTSWAMGNAIEQSRILSRQKRYLIFPEGSNLQLVYCLTVGTFAKENDVVMGMTAALAWELPSKVDSKISELLHRSSMLQSCQTVKEKTQGSSLSLLLFSSLFCVCIQRKLASHSSPKRDITCKWNAFFLGLPKDGGRFERSEDQAYEHAYLSRENCEQLYPSCRHSIYQLEF